MISGAVRVKAWIDGSDYVYIRHGGGAVWFAHRNWQFPGLWNYTGGVPVYDPPLPTYVDGVEWLPQWPDYRPYPYGGYIYLGQRSLNTYISPLPHPQDDWAVTGLNHLDGRGAISIVQYPSSSNGYMGIVLLDDDLQFGAAWYEFELRWTAANVGPIVKVSWLPWMTNTDLALEHRVSIPLKFQLYLGGVNLITTQLPVSLIITAPNSFSQSYILGDGAENLRWTGAPDYCYTGDFKTKDFSRQLVERTMYTGTVYWGNTPLGHLALAKI